LIPTVLAAAAASFSIAAAAWQAPLPTTMPAPEDNPTTDARVRLGQALFFDTRLSSDGTVSCASCHIPAIGGDDDLPVAVGVGGATGTRNAPTVLNAGLQSAQFWDGRAASLEAQALGPMVSPVEMGNASHDDVVATVESIAGYGPLFEAAFGPGDTIDIDNIVNAIGAFERTLLTPNSPFDRYLAGDMTAMTTEQLDGMALFDEKHCTDCHAGPLLALQSTTPGQAFLRRFPRILTSPYVTQYNLLDDLGLFETTGDTADQRQWKVPTLRNIELTAPYFHNGSVDTLDEAVRVMASTQSNEDLTETEVRQLVAFLESLTGEIPDLEAIPVSAAGSAAVPMPGLGLGVLAAGMAAAAVSRTRSTRRGRAAAQS